MSVQAYRVTQSTKPADVVRRWYVVDAEDIVLGRLSTRVAMILRGKHRATFTPHVDTGDFVIVINAAKVKLTGRKLEQKTYYRHSGYTGNLKSTTAGKLLAGPHADRLLDVHYKNLAVADFAGLGGFGDGVDNRVCDIIVHNDFQFDFWYEIYGIFSATVNFGVAGLRSKALDFCHHHAANSGFGQRFANLVEFERFDCRND